MAKRQLKVAKTNDGLRACRRNYPAKRGTAIHRIENTYLGILYTESGSDSVYCDKAEESGQAVRPIRERQEFPPCMDGFRQVPSTLGLPCVNAPAGARFLDHDLAQRRQRRKQFGPKPASEILAGGVLKAVHIIQAAMVDLILDLMERPPDVREVHDPSHLRIKWTPHMDLDPKAVPVHPPALMPDWNVRKPMCRLNREFFKDFHELSLWNTKKLMGLEA